MDAMFQHMFQNTMLPVLATLDRESLIELREYVVKEVDALIESKQPTELESVDDGISTEVH